MLKRILGFLRIPVEFLQQESALILVVKKQPSYYEISQAYLESFDDREGCWHVGNHRMADGFEVGKACALLAMNRLNGGTDDMLISARQGIRPNCYYTCISSSGVVLNRDIPKPDLQLTMSNFLRQLNLEYEKNIKRFNSYED